jgi:hypothetical protein
MCQLVTRAVAQGSPGSPFGLCLGHHRWPQPAGDICRRMPIRGRSTTYHAADQHCRTQPFGLISMCRTFAGVIRQARLYELRHRRGR